MSAYEQWMLDRWDRYAAATDDDTTEHYSTCDGEHPCSCEVYEANLPPVYLAAMVEISRAADRLQSGEITAVRFVVITGVILSGLYAWEQKEASRAEREAVSTHSERTA